MQSSQKKLLEPPGRRLDRTLDRTLDRMPGRVSGGKGWGWSWKLGGMPRSNELESRALGGRGPQVERCWALGEGEAQAGRCKAPDGSEPRDKGCRAPGAQNSSWRALGGRKPQAEGCGASEGSKDCKRSAGTTSQGSDISLVGTLQGNSTSLGMPQGGNMSQAEPACRAPEEEEAAEEVEATCRDHAQGDRM